MASTYSPNLKIELIATGEQSGTWGVTTNTNLGTLLEEAIAGYVTQAVTDGAATVLTIPNGATSNGRNYVIELTGALTANRTVEVPAVDKPYIFFNNTTGGFSVTVKVSGQTGVTIANGKRAIVYTNSTDVIDVVNAPVSEAGTQTLTNKTLSGSSNTFTNIPINSAVSGTLAVGNGGTGQTSYTDGQLLIGTTSGNTLTKATLTAGTGISVTNGSGSVTVTNSSPMTYPASGIPVSTGSSWGTSLTAPTSTVVGIDDTQTLTNKTLSGGTLSGTIAGSPTLSGSPTFTGTSTFSGSSSALAMIVNDIAEVVTVSATAATGTINYDVTTQSVLFYTTNASGNFVVNLRASSGTTLNAALSTGQSVTVAFLVTNGGTAYYNTSVQVDGTTSGVTTRWQGGTAPTTGNVSSVDIYTYTIVKTANATFSVFAAQTRFA
jgi:hypothetical protein